MTSDPSISAPSLSVPARVPLRVGIIGCGWFGRVHVERLSALPDVHLCAVSDPDAAARQRLADLVPPHARDPQAGVATYADYRDLLRHGQAQAEELPAEAGHGKEAQAEEVQEGRQRKRARLDFVAISSPNQWHVEQLLAALECHLHVLCEKPLSMEPDAVRRVVSATQASGKIVAIAYQSRYRRDARVLRHALRSGRWGRITSVNIFGSEDWITPNVGTWRHDPARCPGGFFGDANGHQLDLLFWLTGLQASWVRATTENRGTPVPMVTWGEARLIEREAAEAGEGEGLTAVRPQALTEGVPLTFTFVGDARRWREEISLQTERADFVIRDTRLLWTDGSAPLGPFPDAEADPAALGQPDLPDSALVAALRGGPPVLSPPETVWPVLRFTRAALESAARGNVPISTF